MTLEQLLNKLISLGWKPRRGLEEYILQVRNKTILFVWDWKNYGDTRSEEDANDWEDIYYSLNDLCSIDSGLRQFVCKKCLYTYPRRYEYIRVKELDNSDFNGVTSDVYMHKIEYRLMLSSIQEDKKSFLLNNIKL